MEESCFQIRLVASLREKMEELVNKHVIKPSCLFYIKSSKTELIICYYKGEKKINKHHPSFQGATILLRLDILSYIALHHLQLHKHLKNIEYSLVI